MGQQQQSVLRVQTNIPSIVSGSTIWNSGTTYNNNVLVLYSGITYMSNLSGNTNNIPGVSTIWWSKITQYQTLDTYTSIPLQISRSYAELQDIGARNSDTSINVLLPGTKKNNRFFENFFDVDVTSLYFNATLKFATDILINDESYFNGYMRLNKVSVLDSKIEYDVSLFSSIGNLYGDIGNNLLKDLDYNDGDYHFNHVFSATTVIETWNYSNFSLNQEQPLPYFYPVVHNGYLYSGDTVNFTGGTTLDQTRLFTSTTPLSGFTTYADFVSAGGYGYRINSPKQGIFDNQLKPALSVWNILKLMFKTYGYTIKSDFFNTPWMKSLYMYGYFSSNTSKFSFNTTNPSSYPLVGVQIIFDCPISGATFGQFKAIITTPSGIPCLCNSDVTFHAEFYDTNFPYYPYNYIIDGIIKAGTTGYSENVGLTFLPNLSYSNDVPTGHNLKYFPQPANTIIPVVDGLYVNFSEVVDPQIKQIDILSSVAKKFNLVLIPNPINPYEIIIEPFEYFVGTGNIWDWTDKLSFDKGFTVEPALNYIESSLNITDLEDGDYGNKQFKDQNNRIYGQLLLNNPTDFKSQEKKIETTFSSEVIRQWDVKNSVIPNAGIKLPLGINYAGSSASSTSSTNKSETTNWNYVGVKSKPKLFFNMGRANLFADVPGEVYSGTGTYKSYLAWVSNSNDTAQYGNENVPVIGHTMPIGIQDQYKINNDTCSLLFKPEVSVLVDAVTNTYNCYTSQGAYYLFYQNRVNNLYDPNTRFINGSFYIKPNEYKNLKANDLIRIKDQYFIWNKIDNYNLTNTELTKVELVQINNQTSTYPTRYFKYQYCDATGYTFCMKTDFTNSNLLYSLYGWSVMYDYNCGLIYDTNIQPSGFTSTLLDVRGGTNYYVPYTIQEISVDEYNNSGYLDWTRDTMMTHIFDVVNGPFGTSMPTFWVSTDGTHEGYNCYTGCTQFNSLKTTYGITTESSTYYGTPITTPTPTPTVTPTSITPTPTITPTVTPTKTITPTPTPSSGPSYVTSGLQLYYDYGITASYPGTGSTVYDLSGYGNTATVYNSPTYISSGGGFFEFNGVNNYLTSYIFPSAFSGNNMTYVGVINYYDSGEYHNLYDNGSSIPMTWIDNNRKIEVDAGAYRSTSVYSGQTLQICVTNSNTSGEGCKLYINGTYIGGNTSPQGAITIGNPLSLYNRSNVYGFYGKVGNLMLYNKILTPTEITQNYNAFSTRYGI